MKDSRLPTVANWTERTSVALAYRLAQLAAQRPLLHLIFKRTEANLNIKTNLTIRKHD